MTEVGRVPSDWKVSYVGEAFEICNNLRLPISQKVRSSISGIYPYYGPTKIQDYIDHYRIDGKYALIGEDGDHFLKWDQMSMTQLVNGKFNVNNHAHIVKGRQDASTEWFYFFFSNRDITKHLTRQGAGRYKLTKSSLQKIPFALPPTLTEQRAIATALSDVDDLIAALDRLISKKRAIKQGTMQELLTGRKRLPGFAKASAGAARYKETEAGVVPEDWTLKNLGQSSVIKARIGWQGLTTAEYLDSGDYGLITGTDFEDGFINWESCVYVDKVRYDQDRNIQIREEDILVTKDGTIGKVAYIDFIPQPTTLNSGVFVIRPKDGAYHPRFFYHILMSSYFKNFLSKLSAGSTINHLYQKDFVFFDFPLPPTIEEQNAIAKILSDMDAEIESLEQKRDKYQSIKQGMMQELLTGKTRLI